MKTTRLRMLAALLLICTTGSCSRAVQRPQSENDARIWESDALLWVENHSDTTMKILVIVEGSWKYIGSVDARSRTNFDLWAFETSGAPLRILATTVNGHGSARSNPLTVVPGQTVTFTIEQNLALSSATVR